MFADLDLKTLNDNIKNTSYEVISSVQLIPSSELITNDDNFYNLTDIDLLKNSIIASGLLHPIVITPQRKIISGHRRYKAMQELNYTDIPCTIIRFDSDLDESIALINANSQRKKSDEELRQEVTVLKKYYEIKKNTDPNFQGKVMDHVAETLGVSLATAKRRISSKSNKNTTSSFDRTKKQCLNNINKLLSFQDNLSDIEYQQLKNIKQLLGENNG